MQIDPPSNEKVPHLHLTKRLILVSENPDRDVKNWKQILVNLWRKSILSGSFSMIYEMYLKMHLYWRRKNGPWQPENDTDLWRFGTRASRWKWIVAYFLVALHENMAQLTVLQLNEIWIIAFLATKTPNHGHLWTCKKVIRSQVKSSSFWEALNKHGGRKTVL